MTSTKAQQSVYAIRVLVGIQAF